MSKFDAAIIHLKIYAGIKPVREGEKFSVGYGDIPPVPVRQQDIHASIRVLEAAGKVDKDEALRHISGRTCPTRVVKKVKNCQTCQTLRALLAALPDKVTP